MQEYRGSGAEGFFCKNYTADRYLRSTAVGSGSDGLDLIWDLDRLFTIGRSGPDLESGTVGSAAGLTGARGGSGPLPEWGARSGPMVALRPCGHMAAPDLPPCGGRVRRGFLPITGGS